ncbi:helix-turn-helix domain-containing protein [Paraburkholderia sp. CI3]|uniref:helix-turn-helix domain-containing protein n=1 Tax=Paraburkholderia sp. CI3 TaxID=2991060 RepID=UPI003D20FEB1
MPPTLRRADRLAPKVLTLVAAGHSYREIGRQLAISKNTVLDIVKRARTGECISSGTRR